VLVNFYLFCVLILCARNICASFLVPCFVYSMCFDFKNADNGCFKKKKKKHSWEFGSLGFCSYISSVALSRDRNRLLFVV
jgi:hypothetical protein